MVSFGVGRRLLTNVRELIMKMAVAWPMSVSYTHLRYGYRFGLDRFKRKGRDLCSGTTCDPSRFDHAVGPFDRTDHDSTSPFESVASRLQPHSLCRDQSHLGQTNQGR